MNQERTKTPPDASQWVDQFGDALFRFALNRVGNRQIAEELVQETFLAALGARDRFQGRSSLLTWLIGILRRKVVDHHRRAGVRQAIDRSVNEEAVDDLFFDRRGHWKRPLGAWPDDPGGELEKREFWQVFDGCVSRLPANLADAFRLREIDDCETKDVCDALEISPANLSVRLHRARLLLRRCLELRWFNS